MVDLQNKDEAIVQKLLENERDLTQMHKMLHLRNIAKLKRQLYEYGTPAQISDYEKLVACEDTPLVFSGQSQSDNPVLSTQITD